MRRKILVGVLVAGAAFLPRFFIETSFFADIVSIAGVCLILWLTEVFPPFVPTLILWAAIPLVLAGTDTTYSFSTVMKWAVDPVLALFFGGFALGVAAERHGLDRRMIAFAVRVAGGSYKALLLFVILITAFLSMWLSNIAAAALMFACLRPAFSSMEDGNLLRRMLIIGVALGADLGGMATPIGTGPNAVAIASLAGTQQISFLKWMVFAFPLTIGMLAVSYLMLIWRVRGRTNEWNPVANGSIAESAPRAEGNGQTVFLIILIGTMILWLSEPIHGIPSAVVSIGGSAALFITRTLERESLAKIDWSTLILISGGITLGRLLESSGIVAALSANVPFDSFNPTVALFVICLFTALLAALMSNTASVIMLIPLASVLIPSPSTAILVAISASFGLPFIISTPPNAMAYGEGGLKFSDLFGPGLFLMILGCLVVSLTGPAVLRMAGIP